MNLEISLEDLLKNGSHFGHNKKRWNPKMEKFIYGEKNGTHILDLRKSLPLIENALKFALECSKNKKKFLFVSTKKQHGEIVESIAKNTGNYFVNFRWPSKIYKIITCIFCYTLNNFSMLFFSRDK